MDCHINRKYKYDYLLSFHASYQETNTATHTEFASTTLALQSHATHIA